MALPWARINFGLKLWSGVHAVTLSTFGNFTRLNHPGLSRLRSPPTSITYTYVSVLEVLISKVHEQISRILRRKMRVNPGSGLALNLVQFYTRASESPPPLPLFHSTNAHDLLPRLI